MSARTASRADAVPPKDPPLTVGDLWARLRGVAPWIGVVWVLQLLIAAAAQTHVGAVARAAMRGYLWIPDRHLVAAVAELLADHPSVAAAFQTSVLTSGLAALLLSLVSAGGILTALGGRSRAAEVAAGCVRHLPGIAVQSIYFEILRGLLVGLIVLASVLAAAAKAPPGALPLILLAFLPLWCGLVVARDLARAQVVEGTARPFHPMTALKAFPGVLARPRALAAGCGLALVSLAWAPLAMLAVLTAPTAGTVWALRLGALVVVAAGFARIALWVRAQAPDPDVTRGE